MTNDDSSNPPASTAALQLVPATREAARPHRWFCDACGASAPHAGPPPPFARTCSACERGVLVEAAEELAPGAGDPFLLVDESLIVAACSQAAETLLNREQLIGSRCGELLEVASLEAHGASLAAVVAAAAHGEAAPRSLTVRPVGEFGVRHRLRIGTCGPPRAALLVFDAHPAARGGSGRTGHDHGVPSTARPRLRLCT